MIVGLGLDVVDIARWTGTLDKIENQVFTTHELAACAQRVDRIDALAGRFAAKEACLKALNAGIREGGLREIEVVSREDGAPTIRLQGAIAVRAREVGVHALHVSVSHQEGFAAAVVVLEGKTW